MAHAVTTRNLGRSRSWRKATVRSLAQALLKAERIQTTRARAKEAQRLVERLITLGKQGTLAARRRAFAVLQDASLVHRLFAEIAPRFQKRAGGYTRVVRGGFRSGDGASMAFLELVERSSRERKVEPRVEKKAAPEPPVKAESPKAEGVPKPKPLGFLEGLRKKLFKGRWESLGC